MTTTLHSERMVVSAEHREETAELLQNCLVTLVDLSLQLKQAHWNLVGDRFLSLHVQLDGIIDTARAGADEVAERIATLGLPADGRASTVRESSILGEFPSGRHTVPDTVTMVADRLAQTSGCLRESIAQIGDLDPMSEDLLIGLCRTLEKHLWMIQSQEVNP